MIHELSVKSIHKDTSDSVCVTLDLPETLKEKFKFTQGQNLTFIRDFNGEELRRSYSICSSPNEPELKVGIKQIEGGMFSGWANNDLKAGDRLKVLAPTGHFYVDLESDASKHHVGIAAGSGITPILSIMKATLENEPHSRFTLIYGNRTTDTIMFLEEIEGLKNLYTERLQIFHVLSREQKSSELLSGRIDADKIRRFTETLIPAAGIDEVFLCGPYNMVMAAQQEFINAGIQQKNIHSELFGTPDDLTALAQKSIKPKLSDEEAAHISQIKIIVDDKTTEMDLKRGGESILDAALKVRKELPFACKGGVCATCKAKVLEGKVEMELNYSLTPEEIEQGFILTCQSHPVSDQVVISYDER